MQTAYATTLVGFPSAGNWASLDYKRRWEDNMRAIRTTLAMLSLIIGGGLSAQEPPKSLVLVNGDFSAGNMAWSQAPSAKAHGFVIKPRPGRRGQGVTLTSPSSLSASDGGNITQMVDAKPWRGEAVSLTGWIRTRRAGFVGLAMRVDAGSRGTVFGADTHSQPIPADGHWHEVTLTGRVARDADTIVVALTGEGVVDADYDDVGLALSPPSRVPPSPEASAYLDRAIEFIGKTHINAIGNADWPRLVAQTRSDAAGAKTPADTYPAIEGLLGELHEHHAMLVTTRGQQRSGETAAKNPPTVELQDGRFGIVTLTGISIDDPDNLARHYVDTIREGIAKTDATPVCGWVVDLRSDSGGTTHVMAGAVQGLAKFSAANWPDEYGDPAGLPPDLRWIFTLPAQPLRQGDKPIAILFGAKTASAGEDTALRFIGRPGPLRSFGAPTAGYTSENASLRLSDGAMLAIPAGYMHDRTGTPAKNALVPDEMTAEPMVAAKRWLSEQCR